MPLGSATGILSTKRSLQGKEGTGVLNAYARAGLAGGLVQVAAVLRLSPPCCRRQGGGGAGPRLRLVPTQGLLGARLL